MCIDVIKWLIFFMIGVTKLIVDHASNLIYTSYVAFSY